VTAPGIFGDAEGELEFRLSFRIEALHHAGGERVEGGAVFFGHDRYLAGEAVAKGVLGAALLASSVVGPVES
jgi:hypothetical protein